MNGYARRGMLWFWLAMGVVCAGGTFDAGASTIYTYAEEIGG